MYLSCGVMIAQYCVVTLADNPENLLSMFTIHVDHIGMLAGGSSNQGTYTLPHKVYAQ